jgi:hypothetical protein
LNQHTNDGTLTPAMFEWLGRYHGSVDWILDIATRASAGIAPMPHELRRLEAEPISASAASGWRSNWDPSAG